MLRKGVLLGDGQGIMWRLVDENLELQRSSNGEAGEEGGGH